MFRGIFWQIIGVFTALGGALGSIEDLRFSVLALLGGLVIIFGMVIENTARKVLHRIHNL